MRRSRLIHALSAGALAFTLARCAPPTDAVGVPAAGGPAGLPAADAPAAGDPAAVATASGDPRPLHAASQPCGGKDGDVCEVGLACMYPVGSCGRDGQPGACQRRADVCADIYRPVCGCDGRTYPNACVAARDGVSAAYRGACGRPAEVTE